MDDVKLALLGNREAAKRLTDAGVLLPCPACANIDLKAYDVFGEHFVYCRVCKMTGPIKNFNYDARLAWNLRAPILNTEEMEMLAGLPDDPDDCGNRGRSL